MQTPRLPDYLRPVAPGVFTSALTGHTRPVDYWLAILAVSEAASPIKAAPRVFRAGNVSI